MTALQWLQSTWAGVEPLLDSSLRRDYILTNARGVFGGLMSEYVFAYALAHERRLLEKYRAQTPLVREGVGEDRSEEHTSELQSHSDLVCRLLLEKKKKYGS